MRYIKYINVESIYIEITNKCNFNCVYCYNDSNYTKNEEISFQVIKKIVEFCTQSGVKTLEISGGEPLIHSYFNEILEYIYEKGLRVRLISNGSLFSKHIEILQRYNPMIQTTLDGYTSELNDFQRGDKSFNLIINGIKSLLESKYSGKLVSRCNLSKNNYLYISEYVDYLYNLGVRNIMFEVLNHMGRAMINNDIILKKNKETNQYFELQKKLEELNELYPDMELIGIYDPISTCGYFDVYNQKKTDVSLRVDVYGNLYPCQFIDTKKYILGNLYTTSVEEIISVNKFEEFINEVGNRKEIIEMCQYCVISNYCNGGCPARALMFNEDMNFSDGYCNLRKKVLLRSLMNKEKIVNVR